MPDRPLGADLGHGHEAGDGQRRRQHGLPPRDPDARHAAGHGRPRHVTVGVDPHAHEDRALTPALPIAHSLRLDAHKVRVVIEARSVAPILVVQVGRARPRVIADEREALEERQRRVDPEREIVTVVSDGGGATGGDDTDVAAAKDVVFEPHDAEVGRDRIGRPAIVGLNVQQPDAVAARLSGEARARFDRYFLVVVETDTAAEEQHRRVQRRCGAARACEIRKEQRLQGGAHHRQRGPRRARRPHPRRRSRPRRGGGDRGALRTAGLDRALRRQRPRRRRAPGRRGRSPARRRRPRHQQRRRRGGGARGRGAHRRLALGDGREPLGRDPRRRGLRRAGHHDRGA